MHKPLRSIIGSKKGISLALATGLMTLLMIASMAANELIIRTLRSVRSIEASNRAYFAAEAGVEDALYEVSPHWAGYQTAALGDANARRSVFDTKGNLAKCSDVEKSNRWSNCWAIESRSGLTAWKEKMLKGQKLILSLYADKNENNVGVDEINTEPADIKNLMPSNFSIKFSIPDKEGTKIITDISDIMNYSGEIIVDTDRDGDWNEDGPGTGPDRSNIDCLENPADADCDGKVDEDSDEDPVILWKLTDNTGKSLIPLKGCLRESANPPGAKSEICEKDFRFDNGWSETLDSDTYGEDQDGNPQQIGTFISNSVVGDQIQFEFLIVGPMEFVDPNNPTQRVSIPYLEYEVNSTSDEIPYPYFRINSDGYYGTYKQSIITTLTPKTTVPLFDFTIIQQQ